MASVEAVSSVESAGIVPELTRGREARRRKYGVSIWAPPEGGRLVLVSPRRRSRVRLYADSLAVLAGRGRDRGDRGLRVTGSRPWFGLLLLVRRCSQARSPVRPGAPWVPFCYRGPLSATKCNDNISGLMDRRLVSGIPFAPLRCDPGRRYPCSPVSVRG